ncbi:MAG: hemolysin family protein [Clostridiales Family XIII bacterium]|jgi:CBS domain containing-hemolysin-like protein|nr:hemolysin family protein [Clostridiales Family XIII bacterium]
MSTVDIIVNIAAVAFFVLMNAFFVVAEFSSVRVRKSQVDMMPEGFAKKHVKLVTDHLNDYLSGCQLGITIASLALGWLGEPTVSAMIRPLLSKFGLGESAIHGISIATGFIIITAIHVVIGELVPKSMAILNAEKWVRRSAAPLNFFYKVTYPIMWVFNSITNAIIKLTGHSAADEEIYYSEEEMKMLIEESGKQGLINPEKFEYLDNIFDMEETDAKNIMTPRTDMVCLYAEDSMEEHLKTVLETSFTRYPVCKEEKDNIIGFIHIKDLAALRLRDPDEEDITKIVREISVVHESISIVKLINVFRDEKTKIVIVVDEHGGASGITTLTDVFDEIVGEIEDEYDHGEDTEKWVSVGENKYLVDASMDIDELKEKFGIKLPDEFESDTIGGFVLELFGEFPEEGESVSYENLTFRIKELENFRIIALEIELTPGETGESAETGAEDRAKTDDIQ